MQQEGQQAQAWGAGRCGTPPGVGVWGCGGAMPTSREVRSSWAAWQVEGRHGCGGCRAPRAPRATCQSTMHYAPTGAAADGQRCAFQKRWLQCELVAWHNGIGMPQLDSPTELNGVWAPTPTPTPPMDELPIPVSQRAAPPRHPPCGTHVFNIIHASHASAPLGLSHRWACPTWAGAP